MEVVSFNNEYYISLDDIRSIFKTTQQAFELRIDRYEYECKQLVRIYPNDTVLVSCKTAYAFISWHIENSYELNQDLNGLKKELTKYCKKIPKRVLSRSLRIEIAFRQSYACNACGLFPIPPNFEIDHIMELQDGGQDVSENLQALCPACHAQKTRLNRLRKNKMFCKQVKNDYEAFVKPKGPTENAKVFSKYFSQNAL